MATNLEKCVFFAGGRALTPETNDNTQGLKISKLPDGSWKIELAFTIAASEAKSVIQGYRDFPEVAVSDFEAKYPNQVYFEAFDAKEEPVTIGMKDIQLSICKTKRSEDEGYITLLMSPAIALKKTQNSTT